ncbi:B12-binding domain-containing radical SAM protein [Sulfurospirillum tamanense]|nr:B12-binding domain-containing radical SAM protein [Sulfurospirillum tamanensis]
MLSQNLTCKEKPMHDIVLTTFNARYAHTALGLRYLLANLKEWQPKARLLEFVINTNVAEAAEAILACNPKIVGISAYIWNANEVRELVEIIKKIAPQIWVVLGGPEASHLPHRVDFGKADVIIQGEGEVAFYNLVTQLLTTSEPPQHRISASPVDMKTLILPYAFYTDHDIAHRTCYVEASRGCPFSCEFCLSSLDKKVREIPLPLFLDALETLWKRGVRNFKFIDRTFNLSIATATRLLDFFLAKEGEYFVHFEVIPERFPEALKERIARFAPASLQLEIGIQTLNPDIAKGIHRKLNIPKIAQNLAFLQEHTHAHLHVDLIVGLPGEDLGNFGRNLDMLQSLTQCEIQIGMLKKLSGTTLSRHDEEQGMVYADTPPYEVLQTQDVPFAAMQRMKRFARFWDLVYNSGNFKKTAPKLWRNGKVYAGFGAFSGWIYSQTESTWQISLDRLSWLIFTYLITQMHEDESFVKGLIIEDIMAVPGRKLPKFLRENTPESNVFKTQPSPANKRQRKHTAQAQ